jgi:hypothetical protein
MHKKHPYQCELFCGIAAILQMLLIKNEKRGERFGIKEENN